jgi:hypothetical protein
MTPLEGLYRACISYGLPPSEFWAMTPIEPWWFLSIKNPELFKNSVEAKIKNHVSPLEMLAEMKKHDEVK